MAGLEILTPSVNITALPDRFFSTVDDDTCLANYWFGRDNAYSRRNRRRDRVGPDLITYGAPDVDPLGATVGGGSGNYWDTGIKDSYVGSAITLMAIAAITIPLVAPNANMLTLIGSGRNNVGSGSNLCRNLNGWQMYADYDGGTPSHSEDPAIVTAYNNYVVSCVFGTADDAGVGVYDLTRQMQTYVAAPAGATRTNSNDTLVIGGEATAPSRGQVKMWAAAIWNKVLTADEMAAEYAARKALLGALGQAI